ncbi:DUF2520 domain-containing protein [bacterium]|nr:DUF2520 domain-containing protein [bacterium]
MNENRLTVTVVGYGAVGRALTLALNRADATIVNIAEHEDSERIRIAQEEGFRVFPLEMVRTDVDLVVLAVPDGKIANVASRLAELIRERNRTRSEAVPREDIPAPVVMHLSGGTGLDVLAPLAEQGWGQLAWHPIQTFPPTADADRFKGIRVGLTGDEAGIALGHKLAELVGASPLLVAEQDRARYHLASVLASNFMPMLLEMGAQRFAGIASTMDEAWKALFPLMQGMMENIQQYGPAGAVTGPVARDDLETVLHHLKTFSNPEEEELYRSLIHGLLSLAVRSGRMTPERSREWLEAIGPHSGRN